MPDVTAVGRRRESFAQRVLFHAYDVAVCLVVWAGLVPWALVQIAGRRATWRDLSEWLGRIDLTPSTRPRLVVHAVSAGEAASAVRLVEALRRARPAWTVVMTVGTEEARAVAVAAASRLDTIAGVVRLPWDRGRAVQRWLRRIAPAGLVVVEPEFWPNLFRACGQLGVPLVLVNARVYPRDFARYRMIRSFMGPVLDVPRWIGAESDEAREALVAIGVPDDRIEVTGSLKLDSCEGGPEPLVAQQLAAERTRGVSILVGGSTHDADEAGLLAAFGQLRVTAPSLRLVLAPRQVSRAPTVIDEARRRGFEARASSNTPSTSEAWDVLVIDGFGDLEAIYKVADIAFVGGTLAPHGGHNAAEPARAGCAVVVGAHVAHIRTLVDTLRAANAIVCLPDTTSATLAAALSALLDDEAARTARGARAREAVNGRAGAAARSAARAIAVIEHDAKGTVAFSGRAAQCAEAASWRLDASGGGS